MCISGILTFIIDTFVGQFLSLMSSLRMGHHLSNVHKIQRQLIATLTSFLDISGIDFSPHELILSCCAVAITLIVSFAEVHALNGLDLVQPIKERLELPPSNGQIDGLVSG